jgi:gas vesicle protein
MNHFLTGAFFGATAALLFAPQTGRSTRAKVRDQLCKAQHTAERLCELADKKKKDIANRMQGVQHTICEMKDKAIHKAEELREIAS